MGAHRKPIDETIYGEILDELRRYATKHNCIPNGRSFYHNVLIKRGYTFKYSTFRDHWSTLQLRGHITIDKVTGAPIVHDLRVIDSDRIPIQETEILD